MLNRVGSLGLLLILALHMSGVRGETAAGGFTEVTLAVDDVPKVARFYMDVFRLEAELGPSERFAALVVAGTDPPQRLIIVNRDLPPLAEREDAATKAVVAESTGPLVKTFSVDQLGRTHFGLAVPRKELEGVVARVRAHGIEVTGPLNFHWMDATSYLFLDPAGHLVEAFSPDP